MDMDHPHALSALSFPKPLLQPGPQSSAKHYLLLGTLWKACHMSAQHSLLTCVTEAWFTTRRGSRLQAWSSLGGLYPGIGLPGKAVGRVAAAIPVAHSLVKLTEFGGTH